MATVPFACTPYGVSLCTSPFPNDADVGLYKDGNLDRRNNMVGT